MRRLTDGEREVLAEQNRDAQPTATPAPCSVCGDEGRSWDGEPALCGFCAQEAARQEAAR